MKALIVVAMGLLSVFAGCARPKPIEGALYHMPAEKGGYTVLKILKIDDGGVHVRLYSNMFAQPPTSVDESKLYMAGIDRKPTEALGMGHMPLSRASFRGLKASFVQQSKVTDTELEGYRMWLDAKGGYF